MGFGWFDDVFYMIVNGFLVSCVTRATKIAKGNRTLGKSEGFFE